MKKNIPDLKYKLSLEELRLLDVLMQTRQLSAAAYRFGSSVSTMSRMLSKIRGAFGDPLFVHSGNGMVPTPKMQGLARKIAEVLLLIDNLDKEEAFRPEAIHAPLRIMSADNGLNAYLNAAIPHIHAAAPFAPIIIEPLSENYLEALREGRTHLAIFPCRNLPADFRSLDLPRMHYLLLMRKGHPLEKVQQAHGQLTDDDVNAYPHIIGHPITNSDMLVRESEGETPGRRADLYIPYFNAAVPLLTQTDYVMWCPHASAQLWSKTEMLTCIAADIASCPPDFVPKLIWHERLNCDPACQWLRGMIMNYAQGTPSTSN